MAKRQKPGEIAGRPGKYEERGSRGGEVRKPREVTIDPGDKLPPPKKTRSYLEANWST